MLEISEPKSNINTIVNEIKNEMNLEQDNTYQSYDEMYLSQLDCIEDCLSSVVFYSNVPTKWPEKLDFFPFNFVKIQNFILKIYGFVFKKQRVVNNHLSQAIKANLVFSHKQNLQINNLILALEDLQNKLQTQENIIKKLQSNKEKKEPLVNPELVDDSSPQEKILTTKKKELPLNLIDNNSYSSENKYLLDKFYVELENKFRGTRGDIIKRLRVYLPLIRDISIATNKAPILDLGCGRGEWLELLKNHGYQSEGIDLNKITIEQCKKRGLKVIECDAIEYLKSLPNQSLGAITGFHIIEHLPFKILLELFGEVARVLKKGGVAIFETPNPQNILVASHNFYIDPTHLHPLPSELVKFIAQFQGLSKVEILNLHPYPEHLLFQDSQVGERFNKHFYSAQDYSVIGYKA